MNLKEFQKEVVQWSDYNFGESRGIDAAKDRLLGVQEEVGELSHAILKLTQGIRMGEDHIGNAKDAVGDIMIYLADFCGKMGFCLDTCITDAWDVVKQRNWKNNPITGKAETAEGDIGY